MFRPIWRRVPSADGPVGRWDGPSANILSRLQTGLSADGTAHLRTFCPVCKHLRRDDQSGDFLSTRDAALRRWAYCPFFEHLAHSAVLYFCFLSSFFSVLQVFISSLEDGNPGIILAILWKILWIEKQSNQQAKRRANSKSTYGGTSISPLSTFYQVERVFEAHLRAGRSGERPVRPRVGQGKGIITTILISHLYTEGDYRFSCEMVGHNFYKMFSFVPV